MGNRSIPDHVKQKLYACSGNLCAFPGCHVQLFDNAETTNSKIGEICHIEALSEGGPRYNPNSTDETRNSFDNLILLCANHHTIIDQNPTYYTVACLREMKTSHEQFVQNSLFPNKSSSFANEFNSILREYDFDSILLNQDFDAPFPDTYFFNLIYGNIKIEELLRRFQLSGYEWQIILYFSQLLSSLQSSISQCFCPGGNGFAVPAFSRTNEQRHSIADTLNCIREIYMNLKDAYLPSE